MSVPQRAAAPLHRMSLEYAVRCLAAVCDGAMSLDGSGYNGTDAKFGHRLAELPEEAWTPAMRREAWEMLGKYRHQLANFGVVYDLIPVPPRVDEDIQADARQAARRQLTAYRSNGSREAPPAERTVTFEGEVFVVRFPYDQVLVGEMRGVPGRRWEPMRKVNTIPPVPYAVRALVAFTDRHDFVWDKAAAERRDGLLNATLQDPEPAAAAPTPLEQGVSVGDGRFLVRFEYDRAAVEAIKAIPGRTWDTERKAWSIPMEPFAGSALLEWLEQHPVPVNGDIRAHLERVGVEMRERLEASRAGDAELDLSGFDLPDRLYPFQRAGVVYALRTRRCFIADEMGLGKTIQALIAILVANAFPALIVVPAAVKLNWRREAAKWLKGKRVLVVDSRTPRAQVEWADVMIVNYDIVKARVRAASADKARHSIKDFEPDRLLADLLSRQPKSLVLDESHYAKNAKSQRTTACRLAGESIPATGLRLLLSGTPLMNRPNELISQLQILGRLNDLGGHQHFTRTYCAAQQTRWGYNTNGAGNLLELNNRLRATCFVRRLKKDVMTELPEKLPPALVELEIDNRKEYQQAERDLIAWLMSTARDEKEASAKVLAAMRAEQLVRMNALSMLAARGMMAAAKKWVSDFVDSGSKILLFGWHKEVVHQMGELFNAPIITGDTPVARRQEIAQSFTLNPEAYSVAALNIQAGGTGLDGFQGSCNNAAFLELAWNPALHDQATDRLHRIGQRDVVTPWYLIAAGTIYEDRWAVIEEKRGTFTAAADGVAATQAEDSMTAAVVDRLRRRGTQGG